ncbi:hypothetical protein L2729_11785 [Shewanella gelidimarina]|uniref:hypothetical protein n=1 Tax=Shewanella gelidimarina TaxID=56813 RepID=UPI00200CC467|nr:hypothetical protein [Shewanella gelidimarina]MCL1058667.1 hypothetical protein [Shewanella gelidimarina]
MHASSGIGDGNLHWGINSLWTKSLNFELIRGHNEKLANLGQLAESILHLDPGSAITRLRGFAEEVTKEIYAIDALPKMPQANFIELLKSDAFLYCTEAQTARPTAFPSH